MDSDAPKKTFRSVQKRVVEDIKVEKMTSDASGLGFHNLPFLVHRKSVKKGFEFTLMVVGELIRVRAWFGGVSAALAKVPEKDRHLVGGNLY